MENRFVSISTYAKLVGISRPSVYKRIKSGNAVLLESSEVAIIDLAQSKGFTKRNNWTEIKPQPDCPF